MDKSKKDVLADEATTYKLKKPILVGKNAETQELKFLEVIKFREPTAGDLRGLSLMKVFESDVDSWTMLLSRICEPKLNPEILKQLSIKDTAGLMGKILDFLQ